jgi:hypothetical protein
MGTNAHMKCEYISFFFPFDIHRFFSDLAVPTDKVDHLTKGKRSTLAKGVQMHCKYIQCNFYTLLPLHCTVHTQLTLQVQSNKCNTDLQWLILTSKYTTTLDFV